ncbi:MAG: hypothetical protein GOMPHAMPRED_008334 [Gomphillus americanus]|uniref:Transcriptional coactivator p15 (PC4) C-terminal domain-containing protein n=1 Tax=Gomphillus americanus TaxID=1940652 RepID=A0A8H3EYL9_9LECA|nr:MAG: hypothetical protein GOMPHAMPRED_008334 [Gomphillus americanus]
MPISKRKVTSSDEASSADEARSGGGAPAKKVAKTLKSTKGITGGEGSQRKRDGDGNAYWELTGRRRIVVSEFKGNRMISIREYYEKDGKELPGKKGISLPLDQFSALVSLLPQIEEQLQSQGDKLPRPEYGADKAMADGDAAADTAAPNRKANHEETSDEEKGQ